jgi:hypothetical protein
MAQLPPETSNRTSIDKRHNLVRHITPRAACQNSVLVLFSPVRFLSFRGTENTSPSVPAITCRDFDSTLTGGQKKTYSKFSMQKDI